MNEYRFLFVLDVIVLNLLDEGRRTYSLYRMCVLSLIILLALRRTCFSYKAVTEVCLRPVILLLIFTTRCNLFLQEDGAADSVQYTDAHSLHHPRPRPRPSGHWTSHGRT